MTQLDRIEAMVAEVLRHQTPPEGLARLWASYPWLRPTTAPDEPYALAAWVCTGEDGGL